MIEAIKVWLLLGLLVLVLYLAINRQSNWIGELVGMGGLLGLLVVLGIGVVIWPAVLWDIIRGVKAE